MNKSITETICQINHLKEEKNALLLVHNYQPLEIQGIGDFVGDSLQLAQQAAETDSEIIVMCGVRFMAETAKLLKPEAKVLLSHPEAGCPMANMITAEQLRLFKNEHPNAVVVCYVNSSVEVKAESDVCCTSSNAVRIIESIPRDRKILFVPDQNLGSYAAKQAGREVIVWEGYCNVHHQFITFEDVMQVRKDYPDYTLAVHPECKPEVFEKADIVASTKGIADYVAENDKVVIGTEVGMYHQLQQRYPEKMLIPLSAKAICKNMKKSSLDGVLEVLQQENNEIFIPDEIAVKARKAIERMMEITVSGSIKNSWTD